MPLDLSKFVEYDPDGKVDEIDVGDLLDQRNALLDECRRLSKELRAIQVAEGCDSWLYTRINEVLS